MVTVWREEGGALATSAKKGRRSVSRATGKTKAKKAAPAPSVLLAEKALGVVRSLKDIGSYPVPLGRMLDLAGESEATAKLVIAKSLLGDRLLCALPPKEKAPAKALVILREDIDLVLDGWILAGLASLRNLGKGGAFKASDVAKALPKAGAAPKAITDAFEVRTRQARLPRNVGSVRLRTGKGIEPLLFLLEDVTPPIVFVTPHLTANGSGGHDTAPPPFAAAFELAFDRLNRTLGDRNFVLLRALREALPEVRADDFDQGLAALRQMRRFTLESSDGRQARLTKEDVAAGIRDGGSLLVYASRRGS
jgi:hypothetical protein